MSMYKSLKKYTPVLIVILAMVLLYNTVCSQSDIDPRKTEVWEPVPEVVIPGGEFSVKPPSDAIVLFDGSGLDEWAASRHGFRGLSADDAARLDESLEDAEWRVHDGMFTVAPRSGNIRTRRNFTDIQLYLEWKTPFEHSRPGQGWGNSGVFLQGRYEVQILNSWENPTYVNGQAGSIYKQYPPLVNASRKPGEWQNYNILFTAPRFREDGELKTPARVTVFHNGVLIQNNVEIQGNTVYRGQPSYDHHGPAPIVLQDHGDEVSFRNIWVREL